MFKKIFLLVFFNIQLFFVPVYAANQQLQTAAEKVYIYAYPLVLMKITEESTTNVATPNVTGTKVQAPVNQFANVPQFPTANFRDIVRPNADTLYSSAFLDLSKEPMILSVPNTQKRYYLMPMLDAWTNVFASPGKRTTGTQAQNFVVVGPQWKGTLPKGLKEIKAPTNIVWILGRTQTNGAQDYNAVQQIQAQYKLTPLSAWGQSYSPPAGNVNPMFDTKTAPMDQVKKMDAVTFFKTFADVLKKNPPAAADRPMLVELKKMGIVPGQDFDSSKLTPEEIQTLNQATTNAQQKIIAEAKKLGTVKNNWHYLFDLGKYDNNYLLRATIAMMGLGANLPKDTIYPVTFNDIDGQPLNGQNRYILHFNKNQIPPVNAFWSLTLYDNQGFFVPNSLNRYAIGDRDKLQFNPDGSLDLYIQNQSPGTDKEANWLPAPAGDFNLALRLYWPKESVLNRTWSAPGVKKIS